MDYILLARLQEDFWIGTTDGGLAPPPVIFEEADDDLHSEDRTNAARRRKSSRRISGSFAGRNRLARSGKTSNRYRYSSRRRRPSSSPSRYWMPAIAFVGVVAAVTVVAMNWDSIWGKKKVDDAPPPTADHPYEQWKSGFYAETQSGRQAEDKDRWSTAGIAAVDICRIIGTRDYQEDRAVVYRPELADPRPTALFAVFDGHAGDKMSEYAGKNVYDMLYSKSNLHTHTKTVMSNCFQQMEKDFWEKTAKSSPDNQPLKDGSTATVVLLEKDRMKVAWVADSELWIVKKDGTAHPLTKNHNPSNLEEFNRLQSFNTGIKEGRVCKPTEKDGLAGSLAVSRSLGDFPYVPAGVTSEPEYTEYLLDGSEAFFVLASDGVWDLLPDKQQLSSIMESYLASSFNGGPARYLLEQAQSTNQILAQDNATAVIGFFQNFLHESTAQKERDGFAWKMSQAEVKS